MAGTDRHGSLERTVRRMADSAHDGGDSLSHGGQVDHAQSLQGLQFRAHPDFSTEHRLVPPEQIVRAGAACGPVSAWYRFQASCRLLL